MIGKEIDFKFKIWKELAIIVFQLNVRQLNIEFV